MENIGVSRQFAPLSEEEERIGRLLVDAAYSVHKAIGPGLLEKYYEWCLCHELKKRGLEVKRQVNIPLVYDGLEFEDAIRLDLLINDLVICEVKAVEHVNEVWSAQVLSQLKLTGKRLGFLMNFTVPLMKQGIKRFVR